MNRSAAQSFRHNAATPEKTPGGQRGDAMTTHSGAGQDARRYNLTAATLHWIIAVLIVIQIGLGWYMNEALPDHSPAQARIETLHISVGLTILLLVVLRIALRLFRPPPPLPADLPALDATLARATHFLFYVLMLALPLTGWALVSAQTHPIHWWGLSWPRLPVADFLGGPQHKAARHAVMQTHTNYLIWIVLANLALHVGGAVKDQFSGYPVLWRMIPGMSRR
jgi:cytochrome b561